MRIRPVPKSAGSAKGKKLKLTAFLIKDSYKNVEEFLKVDQLRRIAISKDGASGTLFVKSGFRSQPSWVALFDGVAGFNPGEIVNQSSRALYVIKHDDRWF